MACGGCGKKKGYLRKYFYTDSKGQEREYRTEVEAKAAWLRDGKQGAVRHEDSKT